MSDWESYALKLADQLRASGDLQSPAWHAAVAETPRHVLVPTVYKPPEQYYGGQSDLRLNTTEHLDLVYSTNTLVTVIVPNKYGSLRAVSSSTKPDLMMRMLEALDIQEGQQILEIGTGTGYNAALLAHRLGDDNVFSVDIDPELIDTARMRLADLGRHPYLAAGNGAAGWPEHAPYDRIIATCAVRRIPWAWYDQLTAGGKMLVDFKPQGGNLVLLERKIDRLEGRFTAWFGAFMVMRQTSDRDQEPNRPWQPALPLDRQRLTTTPAEPPSVTRFLRSVTSTNQLRHYYVFGEQTRQPIAIRLAADDGSCCEVELTHTARGPAPSARADQRRCGQRSNVPTSNGANGTNQDGTGSVSQRDHIPAMCGSTSRTTSSAGYLHQPEQAGAKRRRSRKTMNGPVSPGCQPW